MRRILDEWGYVPLLAIVAVAVLAWAATHRQHHRPIVQQPVAKLILPARYPSPADYATIRSVAAWRDHALGFPWQEKQQAGWVGVRLLDSLIGHPFTDPACVAAVTLLHGEMEDLENAVKGEDWRHVIPTPDVRVCRGGG